MTSDTFGSMVFSDSVMRQRLTPEVYASLRSTVEQGAKLDLSLADAIASAMAAWAIERGATHFTHWFQPLNGVTAEKHDCFFLPGQEGVLTAFSGKELIVGESDASSFPSGGLRATFEARGYTAWDPTSPAFVKDHTLYIPTAFCAWGGQALDKKTPLLRSMEALSRQAVRVLRLFGNTAVRTVRPMAGAEQEYFLVDREDWARREDLMMAGRTLFGVKAPKGQEMDDHYYGPIKPRVAAYMADLDEELWKLGILAKTEHNEAAPSQHELAPYFTTANIATDQNQLIMEVMQRLAPKHGFVCLLHEKPFAGVNGSGKHNNWSLQTDTGANLLSPGDTPYENAQFLLFLCAVLQAVDDYQDLLRLSVATAGNDERLGGGEAPPAVISVFIGSELSSILQSIEQDTPYAGSQRRTLRLGVDVLPKFTRDTTDRNRTSPFAFTGNKFEFRMVGSSNSIACANIMLNAAVAESLRQYAQELEEAEDFPTALHQLIQRVYREHKRIVFNGNGYDESWLREAVGNRGLLNLRTTADCMPLLISPKNVAMLTSHGIFTETELRARCEIMLDNYVKTVLIEARTMADMALRQILPAVEGRADSLCQMAFHRQSICGGEDSRQAREAKALFALCDQMEEAGEKLRACAETVGDLPDTLARAERVRDTVLPGMRALREPVDQAETLMPEGEWPFPGYRRLMFGTK